MFHTCASISVTGGSRESNLKILHGEFCKLKERKTGGRSNVNESEKCRQRKDADMQRQQQQHGTNNNNIVLTTTTTRSLPLALCGF